MPLKGLALMSGRACAGKRSPARCATVADGPAGPVGELARLHVGDVEVATYADGALLEPTLAPRPHLHPVRSLAGTPVSGAVPDDHRWHLGVGVAIPHVHGSNFWGGRTFHAEDGYRWRDDHGRIRHEGWSVLAANRFVERLGWYAHDGEPLLEERREVLAGPRLGYADCWALEFSFGLRNVTERPVRLGSPASRGRAGAAYGGYFWRLPRQVHRPEVSTPGGHGESAVHGRAAEWLAVRCAPERPDGSAYPPVTLVFEAMDARTAADPWFVRAEEYAGVGSSLAVDQDVELAPGASVDRSVRTLIVDGALDDAAVDRLVGVQRQDDW